jgi:signal transduction histidine kinase
MGWAELLELILVGAGALASLHIVLARSTSARTVWFNPMLYGWSLCWSIWFASVFSSLNLESIHYTRFPYLTAFTDIAKGASLNLQAALLLHGLSVWTGSLRRIPAWIWYALPGTMLAGGAIQIAFHPMATFLANVEPVVRIFLFADICSKLAAIWMLTEGRKRLDHSQIAIARPLRKALIAMIPILGAALWLKLAYGFAGVGRYMWVLLPDLAYLLPPSALVWAAYRTEAVALEVTQSSMRRAQIFALLFFAYIGVKLMWPLSELDRAASWGAAGLGLAATMGPLSAATLRNLSLWLDWGFQREIALLVRLETHLRRTGLSDDSLAEFTARCLGRLLQCKWRVLPLDSPQVAAILASRSQSPGPDATPKLIAMRTTTSRAEVGAWAALNARLLLPVASTEKSWAIALGASRRADRFPVEVEARLESLQATLQQVLLARENLKRSLEAHRRLEEGERLAMLGLLSASTAHEIKNPLSSIRNVAMAAKRDAPPNSVLQKDLEVVVGEVDRLDATVRRMLHFARDRGICEDAPETIRVVAGLLSLEARDKGVALELSVTEDKIPLPLPENDLKAILFNLVLNALSHTPRGSKVSIGFDPGTSTVSVQNDGEIPPDFRSQLFKPLATRGGTGLGLYISRSKAEESGGRLVYAPSPGKTAFRLSWGETR